MEEKEQSNNNGDHMLEQPNGDHMLEQPESTPATPENKGSFISRLKNKKVIITASVIILALAGSAGAYYGYYLPNQPENVVKQAFVDTFSQEALSQSSNFEGEINFSGSGTPEGISKIALSGSSDGGAGLKLALEANILIANLKLEALTPDSKTYYLKLSGIGDLDKLLPLIGGEQLSEDPELQQALSQSLANIDNQWYSIDSQLLGGGVPSPSSINLSSIAASYSGNPFIESVEQLPNENIAGEDSSHYKVTLNSEQFNQFIISLVDQNRDSLELTDDRDIANLKDELKKVDFSKYPLEVWINPQGLINKFSLVAQEGEMKLNFSLVIKDRGSEIKIEAPADSKSILDFVGDVEPLVSLFEGAAGSGSANELNDLLEL